MISVKNVTMKFNLGIEATSFKETFIALFDKKRRVSKERSDIVRVRLGLALSRHRRETGYHPRTKRFESGCKWQ